MAGDIGGGIVLLAVGGLLSLVLYWIIPAFVGILSVSLLAARKRRAAMWVSFALLPSLALHAERAVVRLGMDRVCDKEGGFQLRGEPLPVRGVLLDNRHIYSCSICRALFAEGYEFIEFQPRPSSNESVKRAYLGERDDRCWRIVGRQTLEFDFAPGRCVKLESRESAEAEAMISDFHGTERKWFGAVWAQGHNFYSRAEPERARATLRQYKARPFGWIFFGSWDQFFSSIDCPDATVLLDAPSVLRAFPPKRQ